MRRRCVGPYRLPKNGNKEDWPHRSRRRRLKLPERCAPEKGEEKQRRAIRNQQREAYYSTLTRVKALAEAGDDSNEREEMNEVDSCRGATNNRPCDPYCIITAVIKQAADDYRHLAKK